MSVGGESSEYDFHQMGIAGIVNDSKSYKYGNVIIVLFFTR